MEQPLRFFSGTTYSAVMAAVRVGTWCVYIDCAGSMCNGCVFEYYNSADVDDLKLAFIEAHLEELVDDL